MTLTITPFRIKLKNIGNKQLETEKPATAYINLLLLPLLFLFFSQSVSAQKDTGVVSSLTELSLDDLFNLKVITASGSAQKLSEAPSTITVITDEQIKDRGYEQLEDALRDVQGIDLIHLGGYGPTIIYFRGMYGADNLRALLMIDGIPENNIAGTIDLAGPAYSLHNIERIEIIWGPASAIYGANAFGGVINMITKKGADIKGVEYAKGKGTYNTSLDKVLLGVKKNNFDVAFSGSVYNTDGPVYRNRNPYYSGSFVDDAWSFNGNIIHTTEKFKTTAAFRAFDTPMSFGNILNSATKVLGLPSQGYNNNGNIGVLTQDVRNEHPSLYETYSYTTFLQTEYTATSKLKFLLRGVYRETGSSDQSYVYLSLDSFPILTPNRKIPGKFDTANVDTAHFYRLPIIGFSSRTKAEIYSNYDLSESHKFYAGVQFYQDNVEKGNRGEILDTNKYIIDGIPVTNLYPKLLNRAYTIRNNFGGFVQYELNTNFLGKTNVTIGARYDKNTDYTNPISPRIAFVNQPDEKTTIKLIYGTAFRSPTVTEVNAQDAAGIAVDPEKVTTYEINLIYKPSSKFLVQANGFSNELEDIFVQNSLLGNAFGTKQSLGKASIQGVEGRIDYYPVKGLSLFLNYTYQKGTQTDLTTGNKFDIPNLPNHKANLGLTWYTADLFTLSAITNWVGERELPHSNPYGADKGYVMDGYFVTNMVLTTKNFFDNHVNASINVRNIFNQNYLDPGIRTADGVLYSTVMEQPGRNLLFKVSVMF